MQSNAQGADCSIFAFYICLYQCCSYREPCAVFCLPRHGSCDQGSAYSIPKVNHTAEPCFWAATSFQHKFPGSLIKCEDILPIAKCGIMICVVSRNEMRRFNGYRFRILAQYCDHVPLPPWGQPVRDVPYDEHLQLIECCRLVIFSLMSATPSLCYDGVSAEFPAVV